MFLGLATFLVLSIVALALVFRLVRTVFRFFSGAGKKEGKQPSEKPAKEQKESPGRKEEKVLSENESEQAEKKPAPGQELGDGELGQLYTGALSAGITENFVDKPADVSIDGKAFADAIVKEGVLSYLEFNNRELAGKTFTGFNLIIEKDSRMVLTYAGQAVASITQIDREVEVTVNGEETTLTRQSFRINTFPPSLTRGMVPEDVRRMLDASGRVRLADKDPGLAVDAMLAVFSEPENIRALKRTIDPRIQAKESVRKNSEKKGEAKVNIPKKL